MMQKSRQSWDDKKDVIIPGSKEATLQFCVEHLLQAYLEAIKDHGAFRIALSGGSTPKAIFLKLTTTPFVQEINWKKVHLFWSDERSVLPDNPESNYHMAMEAGFAKVGIPTTQIHRMVAEKNIQEEAVAYENLLKKEIGTQGFDYLCLGMGDDGHTASLFPGTEALFVTGRQVVANYVPQKDTWRMTFTFSCINAAKKIVLYVLGENKKEKILEVFSSKESSYPVQSVGTKNHKALWILDEAAASLLFPK